MSQLYPPMLPPGQVPTEDYVRSWYQALTAIFGQRNGEYRIMRACFDGNFDGSNANFPSNQQNGITGLNELPSALGRDRARLIYNVLNATVRRYMDSSSAPPDIECIPEHFHLESIEMADKKAKFLQHIWDANQMDVKLIQAAYYQSLLDKAIFNIRPAPHTAHKIKIDLAVPDYYFPITRGDDWQHPLAVVYGFRTFESADFMRNPMVFNGDPVFNTVIEFWSPHWFVRLEAGKPPLAIAHNLGFIPWYECHNLPIPHRFRGQGDVDQAVGLNEYLNVLMSSMADMIAYAANPIAVVRGTKVGGTNLPFEPRAVWELERDAQVGFLQWTGAPPSVEAQVLRTIQAIEDTTGVSSPAFGREIPSGVSGQAVRSLLAGFNTRLGTKQQLLGGMLSRMNEGILEMAEKMFPDVPFRVVGEKIDPKTHRGRYDYYTVKPREFGGWYKNRLIFQPSDQAANYFQTVDKYKAGLASKYSTLKALGTRNVWDELERIYIDKEAEVAHQQKLAMAQQGKYVSPQDQQAQADQQKILMDKLAPLMGGGTQALAPKGGYPGASPNATKERADKRQLALTLQKPQPGGVTQPGQPVGPSSPSELPEPDLDLQEVMSKLHQAQNLTGRAALVVDTSKGGAKHGTILIENPADEGSVKAVLGPLAGRFSFTRQDPNKPLPENAAVFYDPSKEGKKKSGVEFRRTPTAYLNAAVLERTKTNNAWVFLLGAMDDKGHVVPIGKTQPQRRINVEPGELIKVRVGQISRRTEDDGSQAFGLGMVVPVESAPMAQPSRVSDIARLFDEGQSA